MNKIIGKNTGQEKLQFTLMFFHTMSMNWFESTRKTWHFSDNSQHTQRLRQTSQNT